MRARIWRACFLALTLSSVAGESRAGQARYEYAGGQGRERFEIQLAGEALLDEGGTRLLSLSSGSTLIGRERDALGLRQIFIRPDGEGALVHRYEHEGRRLPFDDEARQWLADLLARCPLGPAMQARKELRRGGLGGLLEACESQRASFAREAYLLELVRWEGLTVRETRGLPARLVRELPARASQQVVLLALAERFPSDAALTLALATATQGVKEASVREVLLRALCKERRLDAVSVRVLCEAALSLTSASAREGVLRQLSRRQSANEELTFLLVNAARQLPSHAAQLSLLGFLCERRRLDEPSSLAVLEAVRDSASEQGSGRLLGTLAGTAPPTEAFLVDFFRTLLSLRSAGAQERAMMAWLAREEATVLAVELVLETASQLESEESRAKVRERLAEVLQAPAVSR